MSIYINGVNCAICNKKILVNQKRISFPPFVANKEDPMWIFNDANVHELCFKNHPLANEVLNRIESIEKTRNNKHTCNYCNDIITNPDDYFTTANITNSLSDELYEFNNLELHKKCIKKYKKIIKLRNLLIEKDKSGQIEGDYIKFLINDININL